MSRPPRMIICEAKFLEYGKMYGMICRNKEFSFTTNHRRHVLLFPEPDELPC